jgi:hypothetical protein
MGLPTSWNALLIIFISIYTYILTPLRGCSLEGRDASDLTISVMFVLGGTETSQS